MKKLELKFGSVKEMLTKEQMKQISGGSYSCGYMSHGSTSYGSVICGGAVSNCDCQDQADISCSYDPNCDNIDCGCQ